MKMRFLLVVVSVVISNESVFSARLRDFPPYVKVRKCRLSDPNISSCLLEGTRTIKPYLIKGIPELGINPFDPLQIIEATIQEDSPTINYTIVTSNVTIRGLSGYDFKKFDANVSALEWTGRAVVDQINVDGNITITTQLSQVLLSARGKFILNLTNVDFIGYHRAKTVQRNKKVHLTNDETLTKVEPRNCTLKFFFDDSEILNRAINGFLDENADILYKSLKPRLETVVTQVLVQGLYNPLERRIPLNTLYNPN